MRLLGLQPDADAAPYKSVATMSVCLIPGAPPLYCLVGCLCLIGQPCYAQALQWAFAAVPGHPALRDVCDHINRNVITRFSEDAQLNVLERRWPIRHFCIVIDLYGIDGDLAEPLTRHYP